MAGTFTPGEQKTRPGAYFTVQKNGDSRQSGAVNGVTAVVFRSDWGPLNKAVELGVEDGYESVYGNAFTADALREAFAGGAKTIIACRAGNGGSSASLALKDTDSGEALVITARYPGKRAFTATIRGMLGDDSRKECIIYAGAAELERVEFASGEGEAENLAAALASSKNFTVQVKEEKGKAVLADTTQEAFSEGENPTVANADYADAFQKTEAYDFNTICVDTEDTAVHALLHAFVRRIYDAGALAMAVVAEKHTVDLEKRIANAAAFNDNQMHYVLNAHVSEQGTEIDGYQTAARLAGIIGACASNLSLTHSVVTGFTEILERLTNTQMIHAEKNGCIVFSYNSKNQVWIDNAVNTLVTLSEDQDDGWKKIRRTKTRFELIRRINDAADSLAGKVDNDSNGRKTVISRLQGVGISMVDEQKLVSCSVTENETYAADGDSAWFDIDVVDKDSMEHIYLTYKFRYSTNEG